MSTSPPAASVGWQASERRSRDRSWDDVERFFGDVPASLFPGAQALRYELALRYSRTGDLKDALTGTDAFPLLSIGSWLLDDLGVAHGPERERAERRLTLASVLFLGREHLVERMRDVTSPHGVDDAELVSLLSSRVASELEQIAPIDTGGPYLGRRSSDVDNGAGVRSDTPAGGVDLLRNPRWWTVACSVAAAAMRFAGRAEITPAIDAMLADLAAAFHIRAELATIQDDLTAGRATYVIAVLASLADIDEVGPADAPRLLGALAVTDALRTLTDDIRERIARSRRRAEQLRMHTFVDYLSSLRAVVGDPVRPGPNDRPDAAASRFWVGRSNARAQAIAMAERYLVSDRSFRASWETHREGLFGADEVVARFPAGLILEILAANGQDVGQEIDDFIASAAKDRFRYYAHPSSATDTDTLGVVLRLAGLLPALGPHRRAVEAAVRCVERQMVLEGRIPVWVGACDGATADAPPQILLGEGCATVQAHFLIGLTDVFFDRYRVTIAVAVRALSSRFAHVSVGANVNYPTLYALGTLIRLVNSLEHRDLDADFRREVAEFRRQLVRELEARVPVARPSPQQAALAIRACDEAGRTDLMAPTWAEAILQRQAFDGSWPAEPFAAAPNRGSTITSYATVPLTTALCYDALRRAAVVAEPLAHKRLASSG